MAGDDDIAASHARFAADFGHPLPPPAASAEVAASETDDDASSPPWLSMPQPAAVMPKAEAPVAVADTTLVMVKPKKPVKPDAVPPPVFNGEPLPPLYLLDPPKPGGRRYSAEDIDRLSRELERHLASFGVKGTVVDAMPGPVITRFELQPASGVKGSQITNLSRDLARVMSVASVRVVEVIEGKSVIGLEIPNQKREMVSLSEILASTAYTSAVSPLTMGMGKDIAGHPVAVDMAKMPHLLVAGTTGSGKSVAINAMILSMLFKATADQLRLILIDPKMLELSVYEGIPHLLTPVVTDMKDAANASALVRQRDGAPLPADVGPRRAQPRRHEQEGARRDRSRRADFRSAVDDSRPVRRRRSCPARCSDRRWSRCRTSSSSSTNWPT